MIQHTRDMFVVNVIISSLHRARTSFYTLEFLLFNSRSFSLKDGRFCVQFSFSSENSFQNVCDLQHPMIANYLLSQSGFEARRTVPALSGTPHCSHVYPRLTSLTPLCLPAVRRVTSFPALTASPFPRLVHSAHDVKFSTNNISSCK